MQPKENMISITEKTLQDLQFPTVLETLSAICNTDIGKQKALQIKIFSPEKSTVQLSLKIEVREAHLAGL